MINKIRQTFLGEKEMQDTETKIVYVKQSELTGPYAGSIFPLYRVSSQTADTEIKHDWKTITAQARGLENNDGYIVSIFRAYCNNIVGANGFAFQNRSSLKSINTAVQDAFADWQRKEYCCVTGQLNFTSLLRLVVRQFVRDGEAFIRLVTTPDENNKYKFSLQIIDPIAIDIDYNVDKLPNGNRIIMGIEVDTWRKPVAYYARIESMGSYSSYSKQEHERIPAKDMIHWHEVTRSNEVRGISMLESAITKALAINKFGKHSLENAEIGAKNVGFCSRKGNAIIQDPLGVDDLIDEYATDINGNPIMNSSNQPVALDTAISTTANANVTYMNPDNGSINWLPDNTEFYQFKTAFPSDQYAVFVKDHKRDISNSVGVAYSTASGDLESVNFSSSRVGLTAERDNYLYYQRSLVQDVLVPIFRAFLTQAVAMGQIANWTLEKGVDKICKPNFIGKTWEYVNPLDDQKANQLGMLNGLTTRTQLCSQQGTSFEEILEFRQKEKELIKQYGLEEEFAPQPDKKANTNNTDNQDAKDDKGNPKPAKNKE